MSKDSRREVLLQRLVRDTTKCIESLRQEARFLELSLQELLDEFPEIADPLAVYFDGEKGGFQMKPSEVLRRAKPDIEDARTEWLNQGIFDETIDLCPRCHGPATLIGWMDASSLYDPHREVQICFNCGYETRICECSDQGCRNLNDVLNWTEAALRAITLAEEKEEAGE